MSMWQGQTLISMAQHCLAGLLCQRLGAAFGMGSARAAQAGRESGWEPKPRVIARFVSWSLVVMVDRTDLRRASESLPREGSGAGSGPGHGGLFLEVAWDLQASPSGPVGTRSLQRILTMHRKCPSCSHLFRGFPKPFLPPAWPAPQEGLALSPGSS